MRRRATITYKTSKGLVHDTIWIQNLVQEDIVNNAVLLKVFYDENNKAVVSTNNDQVQQYQASVPVQDGAFAYIPVNAMKALVAVGRVKDLENEGKWLQLVLDPLRPPMTAFNLATAVKKI